MLSWQTSRRAINLPSLVHQRQNVGTSCLDVTGPLIARQQAARQQHTVRRIKARQAEGLNGRDCARGQQAEALPD
jgi:hypothetical protein